MLGALLRSSLFDPHHPIFGEQRIVLLERLCRGSAAAFMWLRLGQALTLNREAGLLLRMALGVGGDVKTYVKVQALIVAAFASFFAVAFDIVKDKSDEVLSDVTAAAAILVRSRPG